MLFSEFPTANQFSLVQRFNPVCRICNTHITKFLLSLIDLVFCSCHTLIKKVEVVPGMSDHDAVLTDLSAHVNQTHNPPKQIFSYNKADWNLIRGKIKHFCDTFLLSTKTYTVEDAWQFFKNEILSLISKQVPS